MMVTQSQYFPRPYVYEPESAVLSDIDHHRGRLYPAVSCSISYFYESALWLVKAPYKQGRELTFIMCAETFQGTGAEILVENSPKQLL